MRTAYCWQSGQIEVGTWVPEGALPIASAPAAEIRKAIQGTARLAFDNETYLVPGLPEAKTPDARLNALEAYTAMVKERLEKTSKR